MSSSLPPGGGRLAPHAALAGWRSAGPTHSPTPTLPFQSRESSRHVDFNASRLVRLAPPCMRLVHTGQPHFTSPRRKPRSRCKLALRSGLLPELTHQVGLKIPSSRCLRDARASPACGCLWESAIAWRTCRPSLGAKAKLFFTALRRTCRLG